MKMKRKLMAALICMLLICLAVGCGYAYWPDDFGNAVSGPTTAPHEHSWSNWDITKPATCSATGTRIRYCRGCQQQQTETIPKTDHTWGAWKITKAATCAATGTRTRSCTVCGETQTESIAKTEHSWGEWVIAREATCEAAGTKIRTCKVCGATQTEATPKAEHRWAAWKVTKEPTCTAKGKRTHRCAVCGRTESQDLKKIAHTPGEWTVTKEPTCKAGGQKQATCSMCGKKLTEKLPKTDHTYEDWVTVTEPTDFSKGKKTASCKFCGKKKTESFYPEGTLAIDLDNDSGAVKELQGTLAGMGLFKGKASGDFDKATASAVKKAQKSLGHKQDGVGWPGLLKLLGLFGKMGDPITEDPSKYKLQLEVIQTSPKKDYYAVGDKLTDQWTLTNVSTKSTAKNLSVAVFAGLTPKKSTDTVIDHPGDLEKGASTSGTYTYEVTKKDALAGKFTFGFIARGKLGKNNVDSNKVCFVNPASAGTGGMGGWAPPSEELLTITKNVTNTPKLVSFFVKGEKIEFEIVIKNKTAKEVKNIIVTDPLMGTSWKKTIASLAGAATKTYKVDYTVKAKDLSEVTNTAVISYTGADGKAKISKAVAKAPVGQNTDALHIYKTDIGSPANGLFYLPDETVTFEITVTNPTLRTFTDLKIYDWLTSKKTPYKTATKLDPGKSITFTYTAKVTKLMAKLGKMRNVVSATYKDPDKKKPQNVSTECTVPCGLKGQDGVIVVKTVISTPENGKYYQDGEEIRYQIDITNNTVADIVDMEVRDSLAEIDINGYRTIHTGEKLAAGDTFTTHFSYVVGPYDVECTQVTNMASAYWTVDKTEYVETYSEPVTVPTAEVYVARKPKPVELEGEACVPTLSAVGEGVTKRDLDECTEHTETAEKAEQLIGQGQTDQAVALWDTDIEELYQEWIGATEGDGRRAAENERAAYGHQMEALEASLDLVCSEADAESIAVQERMDKCVDMCYELHAAPETRKDSMTGDHVTLSKNNTSDECARTVTYGTGNASFLDDQCESHTLTMQLTQYLLDIAADDEDREAAWLRAQGNWLLELDSMYDTWYLSADAVERVVIAADRMSFDELINARRDALAEMYPDDPATAAEVLANMIMNRTETMCRVLHDAGILTE